MEVRWIIVELVHFSKIIGLQRGVSLNLEKSFTGYFQYYFIRRKAVQNFLREKYINIAENLINTLSNKKKYHQRIQ